MPNPTPGLFGIQYSNRDYTQPETWGKNQFNSSFPASLACYLHSRGLRAVYIKADSQLAPVIDNIGIDEVFGIDPMSDRTYYAFESPYLPYQRYVVGNIPRNDLVIMDREVSTCLSSLEIKLTALPDNSTCHLTENLYGSELVIRPDTIIYLACSIIGKFDNREELLDILENVGSYIIDWTQADHVIPYLSQMRVVIQHIVERKNHLQTPIILQPIWKTEGKSPRLAQNCLDVFVWSDFGMLNLFLPDPEENTFNSISRHTRSMVWLFKMLYDYSRLGYFNGQQIIDELSYNTKNDKAFSTNGKRTHPLMACPELTRPRIPKDAIRKIILGGGQNLLSPERRFDAIIYNSPDLFDEIQEVNHERN